MLALSVAGATVMAYLTTRHFATSSSAICNFGARFSCDLVNKSTFSAIFGIPVSVLGLGYFASMAALALQKKIDATAAVVVATIFSLTFGGYLTYIEVALLGSICVFCEFAKLLMVGILATVYATAATDAQKPARSWLAATIAVGLLASFGIHSINAI